MISNDVTYWIESLDFNELRAACSGRKVYVWGAYSKGAILCNVLEKKGFVVSGFLDSFYFDQQYCGKIVKKPDAILHEMPKPFIIIAVESIREEILSWLSSNDYHNAIDFLYFDKNVSQVEIRSLRGLYEDKYNNRFFYDGNSTLDENVRIVSKGGKNLVSIGNDLNVMGGALIIKVSFGSTVTIGRNVQISGAVILNATSGGAIEIGNGFTARDGCIINAIDNGNIVIGNKVTTGYRFYLTSGINSPVQIGHDCMISHDVSIHGTNGHSIIDLCSKDSISLNSEKPIIIGRHVWLGKNSTIMYGTTIGDNSVVGACALLKGDYPGQSIIAGNIARVIRDNCSWDRQRNIVSTQSRLP